MADCPDMLAQVDVARVRFALDFLSPCSLQPADFLGLGRALRMSGRQLRDSLDAAAKAQCDAFFQPVVSVDPVARRKFQKPAPAYVMHMPIVNHQAVDVGDQLACEVLFLGTGVPLIHVFLRSLIHLGQLGLHAGEGRFDVTEVTALGIDQADQKIWRQGTPVTDLPCNVQPLSWFLQRDRPLAELSLRFITPTRLMAAGRPLRKPRFDQVFPFMVRRVTSMLHAHAGVEIIDDLERLFILARQVTMLDSELVWQDWRALKAQGLEVGGFLGTMHLSGSSLDEIHWILAAAELFGIGKAATTGAGRFVIDP